MQKISKKNTLFFYNFYFLIFGSRNYFRQLQMCNLNRMLITHNQWFLIFMNFKEKYK